MRTKAAQTLKQQQNKNRIRFGYAARGSAAPIHRLPMHSPAESQPAALTPGSTESNVLTLQRTIGNQRTIQELSDPNSQISQLMRLNTGPVLQAKDGLEGVKINLNSSKPAQVGALAYTQGNRIEVAPSQNRPDIIQHELGHVFQQAQGWVKPTGTIAGMPLNDDPKLEKEADIIGSTIQNQTGITALQRSVEDLAVLQMFNRKNFLYTNNSVIQLNGGFQKDQVIKHAGKYGSVKAVLPGNKYNIRIDYADVANVDEGDLTAAEDEIFVYRIETVSRMVTTDNIPKPLMAPKAYDKIRKGESPAAIPATQSDLNSSMMNQQSGSSSSWFLSVCLNRTGKQDGYVGENNALIKAKVKTKFLIPNPQGQHEAEYLYTRPIMSEDSEVLIRGRSSDAQSLDTTEQDPLRIDPTVDGWPISNVKITQNNYSHIRIKNPSNGSIFRILHSAQKGYHYKSGSKYYFIILDRADRPTKITRGTSGTYNPSTAATLSGWNTRRIIVPTSGATRGALPSD